MLPKFKIAENAKYRIGIFMLNIRVKQFQEGEWKCYNIVQVLPSLD